MFDAVLNGDAAQPRPLGPAAAISVLIHALALALIAWASTRTPAPPRDGQAAITFMAGPRALAPPIGPPLRSLAGKASPRHEFAPDEETFAAAPINREPCATTCRVEAPARSARQRRTIDARRRGRHRRRRDRRRAGRSPRRHGRRRPRRKLTDGSPSIRPGNDSAGANCWARSCLHSRSSRSSGRGFDNCQVRNHHGR